MQVHNGLIKVSQTSDDQVIVSGSVPDEFEMVQEGDQLLLTASQGEIELQIALPPGVDLSVSNFDADIEINAVENNMRVFSEAGDITMSDSQANAVLRSGRGDIQVSDCRGQISLLGEHGLLQMSQVHGDISATSIMGTVQYNGEPAAGDDIWLETDHGPVQVGLQPGASLVLESNTAGGKISCLATALFTNHACSGQAGAGEGQIGIRTVSGNITIKAIP